MVITLYKIFVASEHVTIETFSLDDLGEIMSKIGSPISQEGKGVLTADSSQWAGSLKLQANEFCQQFCPKERHTWKNIKIWMCRPQYSPFSLFCSNEAYLATFCFRVLF